MESVAIDAASAEHFDLLTAVSTIVCFSLMAFGLRSFLIGLMVFGTAQLCQQFALALVIYTGSQMDRRDADVTLTGLRALHLRRDPHC